MDSPTPAPSAPRQRTSFIWVAALGVAVAFLAVANAVRLVPYAVVWGDLATWAQALLTGAGLAFAATSVRLAARSISEARLADERRHTEAINERQRRDQDEKTRARRSVLIKCRWTTLYEPRPHHSGKRARLTYEVVNASQYPITNCKLIIHVWDDDTEQHYDPEGLKAHPEDYLQAIAIGSLAPGERATGTQDITNQRVSHPMYLAEPAATPDFFFTDAWGMSWKRNGTTHARKPTADEQQDGPLCMCCGTPADNVSR